MREFACGFSPKFCGPRRTRDDRARDYRVLMVRIVAANDAWSEERRGSEPRKGRA